MKTAKSTLTLFTTAEFAASRDFVATLPADVAFPKFQQILFFSLVHCGDCSLLSVFPDAIKRIAMMETKDVIALVAIFATLAVAAANFIYTLVHNRRAAFVNTVTSSRLKWIDSLRDKVASFIAVTVCIVNPASQGGESQDMNSLLRDRDTLTHQIVLHLNPNDAEDQAIRKSVESIVELTSGGAYSTELRKMLSDLRDATQIYLKKEWNRVKTESTSGEQR